jgi:hypothetical protein
MSGEIRGGSPWVFLLGLVVFLGSAVLFVVDLLGTGTVLRSLGANAASAAILIAWAAHDTLFDPNSEVDTRGGAVGTALLLYGLYLAVAGAVVGATGLVFHDRPILGAWYLGLAVFATLVGFLAFPTEAVVESADDTETE